MVRWRLSRELEGVSGGPMPCSSGSYPCGRAEPAPPGEAERGGGGLTGKCRGRRVRRFSRRDAVSASASTGRTQAGAGHHYGRAGVRKVGGLTGRSCGGSKAPLAGVRSPPLRGEAKRGGGGLTGKCRGRRVRRFSRRDAVSASASTGWT